MTIPSSGRMSASIQGDYGFDDEPRSAGFHGALRAGLRLTVFADRNGEPTDDVSVIVAEIDFLGSICVGTFEEHGVYSKVLRQTKSKRNGLDGKVKRIELYMPTESYMTYRVAERPQWGAEFSEEQGAYDEAINGPIVGLWCSGNSCDNKIIMHARYSECKGSWHSSTSWFSEVSLQTAM